MTVEGLLFSSLKSMINDVNANAAQEFGIVKKMKLEQRNRVFLFFTLRFVLEGNHSKRKRRRRRRDLQPSFQVSVKSIQNSNERFWNSKQLGNFMNSKMTNFVMNIPPKYRYFLKRLLLTPRTLFSLLSFSQNGKNFKLEF